MRLGSGVTDGTSSRKNCARDYKCICSTTTVAPVLSILYEKLFRDSRMFFFLLDDKKIVTVATILDSVAATLK